QLLANPRVRAAMRCGPVSVPNHKLVPDTRWVLNAGVDDVIPRSDATQKARTTRGVAIVTTNRQSLLRQGFDTDGTRNQAIAEVLPPPGFRWIAATAYYGGYAR